MTDDLELVRQAKRGTREREAAFTALYERHKDEVFGFLVRLLGDRSLAEDVLQESFYRVYRSLDRHDGVRPFRPWLHQIVRRAALDALASRRKEREAIEGRAAEPPPSIEPPVGEIEKGEAVARAREAFASLPDETRLVLHQRHGLGLSLGALAEAWAVTDRTVRNRLRAAAAELARALLAKRGEA